MGGSTLHGSAFHASFAHHWPTRLTFASLLLLLFGLCCASSARATEPFSLFGPPFADTPETVLQALPDDAPPTKFAEVDRWIEAHEVLPGVDMLGGRFWILTRFRPESRKSAWSVTLANSWYRHATITILGDDGSRQSHAADRDGSRSILAYHAVETQLSPDHEYVILVEVATPFFTSLPRIDVQGIEAFHQRQTNEIVLTIATLGLLTGLGVFVLFVGFWIGERSYLLYGVQSLILVLGWGFYFGLPHGWFGIDTGRFNFSIWFILLSIANALFTISFLELKRHAPLLMRCGHGIAALALLALPLSLLFPSLAHFLASTQVSLVVTFSICAGLWALGHGIRQARFFVLAFLCVLIPGLVILPANFGLIPDILDNSDLLTLLGSGGEAMLLALALADNVRLLTDARERFRSGMQEAVTQASIDPLTGIGNRLSFNVAIKDLTNRANTEPLGGTVQIAMIDLDGLKFINDHEGHQRGDALLRETGDGLARLAGDHVQVFRLGGDEFAVISIGDDLSRQRLAKSLATLDEDLRSGGFANAGISFGLRSASVARRRLSSAELAELVREADRAMYRQKARRREARREGKLSI